MHEEKRGVGRPRAKERRKVFCFRIAPEAVKQAEDLVEALNISKSAVVAQAIARWHDSEPLVKKRKTNGDGNT